MNNRSLFASDINWQVSLKVAFQILLFLSEIVGKSIQRPFRSSHQL